MDPQQRLMLEVAYEAFENAGLPLEAIAGTDTSCYIGNFTTDYRETIFRDPDSAPVYSVSGSGQELISNRVSWFYDLRGPSFTLGTACSSSLVALHQGCQSIRTGESNMAIVGGSNLLLNPEMFMFFSNQNFLAGGGRCRSFDAGGDGYGRGEGFAAVILKNVSDAIRSGDPIRAVIRSTGVNQDGKTKAIAVPNADAQADLIRSTYRSAGLNFHDTHYFEAHGTGTKAGDPLELEGIWKTLGAARKPGNDIVVGSVKSNIGHLESVAGLAGIIKAIYILENAVIPPNVNFEKPNPKIPFTKWNIKIPTRTCPWPVEGLRRISVQGFGYGGTNAHVILDDAYHYLANKNLKGLHYTKPFNNVGPYSIPILSNGHLSISNDHKNQIIDFGGSKIRKPYRLFVISAYDKDGLTRQRQSLVSYLNDPQREFVKDAQKEDLQLQNLAFTFSQRRSQLAWRTFVAASSTEELLRGLGDKGTDVPAFRAAGDPRVGFIFTGQGAQWARMGIELFQYQVFRDSVENADRYLRKILRCPWSAVDEILRDEATSNINLPAYSQPICTILQIALVDLFKSWNIVPTAIAGHSSGEIAGAYCLGALIKEDALKAAYFRGLLSSQMKIFSKPLLGGMLAVGTSEEDAQNWVTRVTSGQVVVACVNSPSSVTMSGDTSAIEELHGLLKQAGVFARKLKVDTAYHSPHMESIAVPYLEAMRDIQVQAGHQSRKMYSAVSGTLADSEELGPINWVRNLTSPVLFYDAVLELLLPMQAEQKAAEPAVDILVEIGPHSALRGPINQIIKKHGINGVDYQCVLSRDQNAAQTALTAVGALFAQGVPVKVSEVNGGRENPFGASLRPLIDLPSYAWNHSRTYWAESRISKQHRFRSHPPRSLIGAPCPSFGDVERLWRGFLRVDEEPWVRDHMIQSSMLYPAAGYIAMAIEGACEMAAAGQTVADIRLRDVQIIAPAVITEGSNLECILQIRPHFSGSQDESYTWLEFTVSTCDGGQELRKNCHGLLQLDYQSAEDTGSRVEGSFEDQAFKKHYISAETLCQTREDPKDFYRELASLGLMYGPTFQNVTQIKRCQGQSCCTVKISDQIPVARYNGGERPHVIHPSTLDAMFHAVFAAFKHQKGQLKDAMVPKSIDEIVVSTNTPFEIGTQFKGYSNASRYGFRELVSDVVMFDQSLVKPVVKVKGFHCTAISGTGQEDESRQQSKAGKLYSKMIWTADLELCPPSEGKAMTNGVTSKVPSSGIVSNGASRANGSQGPQFTILESARPSKAAQDFTLQLVTKLESHHVKVQRVRWGPHVVERAMDECVSLLDLDAPFLLDLTDKDFALLQQLIITCPSLLWVTALDDPGADLAIGMARSIRNEMPGKKLRTISLRPASLELIDQTAELVVKVATTTTVDDELRLEDGIINVSRAVEDTSMNDIMSSLLSEERDRVDAMPLKEADGPQKLAIKTQDVMVAMGQIPDTLLGFEASGYVSRIGKEVSHFNVGDKVCALGHGAHRTMFRNKARFCQPIPNGLSFEEAATLPLVHCTAFYSLMHVAKAKRGQTVLIHAAAGGVGQAAIQIAKHLGLEIFATVGSADKRQLISSLYAIRSDHIFNSRDLSFAKGVMRMTQGRGVDCIINSLSGEALRQSWNCIAAFGSFIEIGMKDILSNTGLDMRPFLQDASFTFFNLKHVMDEKPDLMAEIINGTFDFLCRGIIKPVSPINVYPISEAENAFRLLQTGKHRGKVALKWIGTDVVPVLHRINESIQLNPKATYVLVGGLGGLGRSLAYLLADLGARHICFISRSGDASKPAQQLIKDLENRKVQTRVFKSDIADQQSLKKALQRCSNSMPNIKGVFQCAMVLRDALFERMTHDQWTSSLRPKVQGSWNLHTHLPHDLDFFIILSSFAGIFGNRSQSNYAAAGAYQDSLARYRRAQGLKAVTVDLPVMRDVGVIAEKGASDYLAEWEIPFGMRENELHALMTKIIASEMKNSGQIPAQIINGLVTGESARAAGIRRPFYFDDARFSKLAEHGASAEPQSNGGRLSLREQLGDVDSVASAGRAVTDALVARVAKSLQNDPSEIDQGRPLHSYGVDSLVGVEIANWVFRETKVTVSVFDILATMSIAAFAKNLAEKSPYLSLEGGRK
ncbi:hypothetical protein P7C71_g2555, partial [Lecanoromycetidae sp. Uapishka_2]